MSDEDTFDDSIWSDSSSPLPPAGSGGDERGPRPAPRPARRPLPESVLPVAGRDRPSQQEPRPGRSATASQRSRWVQSVLLVLAGALVGGGLVAVATSGDDASSVGSDAATSMNDAVRAAPLPSGGAPSTKAAPTVTAVVSVPTASPAPPGVKDPMALATALGPLGVPSDCGLPLGEPESLPNADRAYRGGVHEGIDFICGVRGRSATTPLDGWVVVADSSFVDPKPDERLAILDIAKATGDTPPWTLAMLFGRFVVLDHGIVPGVGHVVTIFAHLEKIDPAIRPGARVKAGATIGEIGNRGTESAGTGEVRPQAIHLHWEIHIDGTFLGEGASPAQTKAIYGRLFGRV